MHPYFDRGEIVEASIVLKVGGLIVCSAAHRQKERIAIRLCPIMTEVEGVILNPRARRVFLQLLEADDPRDVDWVPRHERKKQIRYVLPIFFLTYPRQNSTLSCVTRRKASKARYIFHRTSCCQ